MIETEVAIEIECGKLKGILALPSEEGVFPAYVYISGSGPLDRDDNIPGQTLNNAKLIAHHLAQLGIASLRYDKRGVGQSDGDYYTTGHQDLVVDASACLQFLLNHEHIQQEQVFVMGHSEGSIIAPQVALNYTEVAGLVLLAPFCQSLESILLKQAESVKAMIQARRGFKAFLLKAYTRVFDINRSQRKLISKVKSSRVDKMRAGLSKVPAKWFREILALDVAAIYEKTTAPTLLIGGEKDFQCDPADVKKIQAIIGGPVSARIVDDMSHLLRKEPGAPSVFNYKEQLKQELMPEVLATLDDWFTLQLEQKQERRP